MCAFDTELFGHHWYEGVDWLAAVIDEAGRQGLPIVSLDDAAAERHAPEPIEEHLGSCSWGAGNDLSTWSGPRAEEFPWEARAAELATLATGRRPSDRALRELLALQSSDWAFLHSLALAGDYPRERAHGHLRSLRRALTLEVGAGAAADQSVRHLAPVLAGWEG